MKKSVLSLIILFCIFIFEIKIVYSLSLPSSIEVEGNIGDNIKTIFTLENTENFTLSNISLLTTPLTLINDNSKSIPNENINFVPNKLNLTSYERKEIILEVILENSTYPGTYYGIITASTVNSSNSTILLITANPPGPKVVSYSPSNIIKTPSSILEITTDKDAICRYSRSPGISYELMDNFDITGDTIHIETLTNLVDGLYRYYVKCKDIIRGNIGEEKEISFRVDIPPSANIVLDKQPPLTTGTVKVIVITSEDVYPAPTLQVSYDSISYTSIPLVGSGTTWTGYLIIPSSIGNSVGSFKFSAKDLTGNVGTEIKTGGIFIVDTIKPPLITDIQAIGEEGSIKIKWYYNTNDVDHFNIYRSTSRPVDYTHLYRSVTDSFELIDTLVEPGKTYYYRITAVDKAGNEGELSKEVYATALLGNTSSNNVDTINNKPKLSQELIGEVDRIINFINKLSNDAENTLLSIKLKSQKEQHLFEELKLKQKVDSAKSQLNSLLRNLENFKLQDLTRTELEKKLGRVELQAKIVKRSIPENIIINEEKIIKQQLTSHDIERILKEVYKVDEGKIAKYLEKNKKLSDKIEVEISGYSITIVYLDGTQEEGTVIEEKISLDIQGYFDNISLIEFIPKTIVDSIKNIDLKNQNYEIIKEDPILSFTSDTKKVVFFISKKTDLSLIRDIKVIPLLYLEEENLEEPSFTGFFVNIGNLGFNDSDIKAIIAGIFIILGLFLYFIILKKKNILKLKHGLYLMLSFL